MENLLYSSSTSVETFELFAVIEVRLQSCRYVIRTRSNLSLLLLGEILPLCHEEWGISSMRNVRSYLPNHTKSQSRTLHENDISVFILHKTVRHLLPSVVYISSMFQSKTKVCDISAFGLPWG